MKIVELLTAGCCLFVISSVGWGNASNIVLTERDCRAYIRADIALALTYETRVLILKKHDPERAGRLKQFVTSKDGLAILWSQRWMENLMHRCTTRSCIGIVMNNSSLCGIDQTSTNCRAIVNKKPDECVDVGN